MNGTCRRLDLLLQTSRHLAPRQILYRLYYLVRKRCWRLVGKRAPSPADARLLHCHPLYHWLQESAAPGVWEHDSIESLRRAREVARQRFRFLNVEVQYPERVDWHDPNISQLWRYHLHYFDYVEDLLVWSAAGHDGSDWDAFARLVDSWIVDNGKIAGDGWHPFTISVRVVNWLNAFYFWKSRFDSDSDSDFTHRFMASLYGQAGILAASLEWDVRGNHLLKNFRALVWCGIAFEGGRAGQWMDRALKTLEREFDEQVLGDGAHFERAPGYHAAVLKDCLEIALWLRRNLPGKAFHWLDDALERMLRYFVWIIPPDGKLPMLKDTAWGTTPPPADLLAAGALYFDNPELKIGEELGVYPLLLFDKEGWEQFRSRPAGGGDRPAVSLPAHAHADMFSYELAVKGQRVIVDSGVCEYAAGQWRDYFRSTRAHNTVEVERRDQSQVWGSFRVARRARPSQVSCREAGNHILLHAKHDGYRRLAVPVIHRRILVWEKGLFWLVVDEVSDYGPQRHGGHREPQDPLSQLRALRASVVRERLRGSVLAESHVHLHPTIRPVQIGSGRWLMEGLPLS